MKTRSFLRRRLHFRILRRAAVALSVLSVSIFIMPTPLAATNVGHVDKLARQCRSGKQSACTELAKIGVGDKDASVRSAAVAKLTDQSLLTKVAVEDKDASVRSTAVAKLTDQSLLAKIGVEDNDAGVRSAAMAKLTDQPLLVKIALEATDASVRTAAVVKLTDQSLLAKIAVQDKDAGVRSAAVAASQQILRDITEGRDIVDLLNEKKIEIEARGSGIQWVSVRVRRLVPYSFTVRIPVGSFFVSSDPSAQNMVTTAESKVQLTSEGWVSVSAAAACANRPKHVPGSSDAFTVLRSPHQEELAKLMPVLDKAQVDTKTRQAAVWIVTDNADYDDLGILVASPYGAAFRVINEQETALAMKICDEAGIDITKKAIWKDRFRVFSRLKDHDLEAWLDKRVAVSAGTITATTQPEALFETKGKGVIYVFREGSFVGAAGRPKIFVNGDYLATLHNSNYATVEVPQGVAFVTATVSLLSYGHFPPLPGDWASGPGCAAINWQQLVMTDKFVLATCMSELRDLLGKCGIRVHLSPPLKITEIPSCNYKLAGADSAFNYIDLALRRPQELRHGWLDINVEAGKKYYVKWSVSSSGGKMKIVDEEAGAKRIAKLHLAQD